MSQQTDAIEITSEDDLIRLNKVDRALAAGVSAEAAYRFVAANGDIHLLEALIKRGCLVETALRIAS